jgi:uncharacterized protein YigE (DUF2233 family)
MIVLILGIFLSTSFTTLYAPRFYGYEVNLKSAQIRTYWLGADGKPLNSLSALKSHVNKQGKQVLFAMNCGMFTAAYRPVGLYIEGGKQYSGIKKCGGGKVNFCLQPQGIFYITNNGKAGISKVANFSTKDVSYATQSAPLVVIDGKQNPALPKGLRLIRNGAGIRKDGFVVLALSAEPVNFYEFAQYFISKGCTTAMYFDGNVSAAYHNGTFFPYNGAFGAMIAVIK